MHTQEKKKGERRKKRRKVKVATLQKKKTKQGGVFVVKFYSVEPVFSSQPILKGYPAIFCG